MFKHVSLEKHCTFKLPQYLTVIFLLRENNLILFYLNWCFVCICVSGGGVLGTLEQELQRVVSYHVGARN